MSIEHLNRSGRKKGVQNLATRNAREAISRLVDGNADRMQGWLDEIAKKHGALAAWRCMNDVIEYHIPKLQRTELTGPEGKELSVTVQRFTHDGE